MRGASSLAAIVTLFINPREIKTVCPQTSLVIHAGKYAKQTTFYRA
jgi:hypothetical protein